MTRKGNINNRSYRSYWSYLLSTLEKSSDFLYLFNLTRISIPPKVRKVQQARDPEKKRNSPFFSPPSWRISARWDGSMLFLSATTRKTHQSRLKYYDTVEGRNLAITSWYCKYPIIYRFLFTSQVVQEISSINSSLPTWILDQKNWDLLKRVGKKSKHHSPELRHLHPAKTNMALKNPAFEDVFPIEHGDLPMSC